MVERMCITVTSTSIRDCWGWFKVPADGRVCYMELACYVSIKVSACSPVASKIIVR